MSSETASFAIRNVILPFVEKTREVLESLRELATTTAKELAILAERMSSIERRVEEMEKRIAERTPMIEDYALFKKKHKEHMDDTEARFRGVEKHEPQSAKGRLTLWTSIVTALSAVAIAVVDRLGGS